MLEVEVFEVWSEPPAVVRPAHTLTLETCLGDSSNEAVRLSG